MSRTPSSPGKLLLSKAPQHSCGYARAACAAMSSYACALTRTIAGPDASRCCGRTSAGIFMPGGSSLRWRNEPNWNLDPHRNVDAALQRGRELHGPDHVLRSTIEFRITGRHVYD